MPIVPKKEVWTFLSKLKVLPDEKMTIADRKKNRDFLASLGATHDEAFDVLRSLAVRDYIKGPEPDDNADFADSEWWFFAPDVGTWGVKVYIKVRLIESKNDSVGVALSFHDHSGRCHYPYRFSGQGR